MYQLIRRVCSTFEAQVEPIKAFYSLKLFEGPQNLKNLNRARGFLWPGACLPKINKSLANFENFHPLDSSFQGFPSSSGFASKISACQVFKLFGFRFQKLVKTEARLNLEKLSKFVESPKRIRSCYKLKSVWGLPLRGSPDGGLFKNEIKVSKTEKALTTLLNILKLLQIVGGLKSWTNLQNLKSLIPTE